MKQYKERLPKRVNNRRRHRGKKKLNIAYVLIPSILIVLFAIYILCNVFYKMGYDHKFEEEYDSMYQMAKYDAYYDGFMEGLTAAKTEGIERKTKLIAAYNSLMRSEGLSETDQKAYTYRLNELLRSPVPEEEKVNQFIEDVQEILSSDI